MSTPMIPGNSYTDFQGSQFSVETTDVPTNGAVKITVFFRGKVLVVYGDAARLSDSGQFQFNLTGTATWYFMQFAPIKSGYTPA